MVFIFHYAQTAALPFTALTVDAIVIVVSSGSQFHSQGGGRQTFRLSMAIVTLIFP